MSKSTCSASFGSSEDKIWSLITGQSDHTWRTDLLRIEEGEKSILLLNIIRMVML